MQPSQFISKITLVLSASFCLTFVVVCSIQYLTALLTPIMFRLLEITGHSFILLGNEPQRTISCCGFILFTKKADIVVLATRESVFGRLIFSNLDLELQCCHLGMTYGLSK